MKSKTTKQIFIPFLLIVALMIGLVGCDSAEDHIGEAQPPSSPTLKGKSYEDAVKAFEEEGFTNIKLDKLEDLVTGWMTKEGEVEKVSVGGDESYDPDKWVANDVDVVITYHSFPEKEESSETEKSESSEGNQSSSSLPEEITEEILTSENNEELAKVLITKDNLDPIIKSFAEKYAGCIIEFDASVADITKHKDYKTRYDILVYVGDYSETETSGPSFKFEDVNIVSDLNLTGSNIPDDLVVGQHIRVTAKIKEYRDDSGLFIIKPVSTEIR